MDKKQNKDVLEAQLAATLKATLESSTTSVENVQSIEGDGNVQIGNSNSGGSNQQTIRGNNNTQRTTTND